MLVSGEAGIGKTALVRAFAAPEWRRPWADGGIPERRGDLPATIHGGS